MLIFAIISSTYYTIYCVLCLCHFAFFLELDINKYVFGTSNDLLNSKYILQKFVASKFSLKLSTLTFWSKFSQKRALPAKIEKSEQHHWIQHIRISLDTKFQLQLIILTFWTKFAQKGYFRSKTEKVNITIEFCMFELV